MKRSLPRWILLITLSGMFFAAGYGFREWLEVDPPKQITKKRDARKRPEGFWFRKEHAMKTAQPSTEQIANIAALGYVDGLKKAGATHGVIT